ncbi:hypothetical protein GcC1_106012 [Golovinomyces cichoracearum]|uniref:Uncharacterized protein n=1 Tax=Golovinomyces cichoracearum TaxID=62708 RepID=A0A420I9E6_9PEZI|nr:hypothetical protein GcC1_106012 [Golovinomyces cichoracearum]
MLENIDNKLVMNSSKMVDKKDKMPEVSQMKALNPKNHLNTTSPSIKKTPLQLDKQAISVLHNLTQTQETEEYYHSSKHLNEQQPNRVHYKNISITQSSFQPNTEPQNQYLKSNGYDVQNQESEYVENNRKHFQNNPSQNITNRISTKDYELMLNIGL